MNSQITRRALRALTVAAASLALATLATACTDQASLRHESITLPTRDVFLVDPQANGSSAVGADVRAQLRDLLLTGDTLALASDKATAGAILEHLKTCSTDCLVTSAPVTVAKHRYILASVASPEPSKPGAAFAFLDKEGTYHLALVATGYDVFLGPAEKGTIVAMAGSSSDAASEPIYKKYRVAEDGRLIR